MKKAKKTNLEKYEVDNPMKLNNIKEKVKETNLKKYGVDNYTKTDEYKKKSKRNQFRKIRKRMVFYRQINLKTILKYPIFKN